jgi:hypothetical protein
MSTALLLHSIDMYDSQLKDAYYKIHQKTRRKSTRNMQNPEIRRIFSISFEIVDKFAHLLRYTQDIFDTLTDCEPQNLTIMKIGKNVEDVSCKFLLDLTIDVVYKMRAFVVALEKPMNTQNRLINQLENQGSYLQTVLQDLRLEETTIFRPEDE